MEGFFYSLSKAVSEERLNTYHRPEDEKRIYAVSRYVWNTAASEALYSSLQNLEITLRNSIHGSITEEFGSPFWSSDTKPKILKHKEWENVAKAKQRLQRANKPITDGRLVAELSFGFWTALFNRSYNQVLWPRLLKATFPFAPRRERASHLLRKRLEKIRRLRNRVFHYEPIFHFQDLQQQHADLLEVIGWISSDVRNLVEATDNFPNKYKEEHLSYVDRLSEMERQMKRG